MIPANNLVSGHPFALPVPRKLFSLSFVHPSAEHRNLAACGSLLFLLSATSRRTGSFSGEISLKLLGEEAGHLREHWLGTGLGLTDNIIT